MGKNNLRYIAVGILAAFLISCTGIITPTFGSELSKMKESQKKVQEEIKGKKKKLQEKKAEEKSLWAQLQSLNNNIEKTERELEDIRSKARVVEKDISETEQELKEAEARLKERLDIFSVRLKEIYQMGSGNFLEVLFEATSFRDFLVRFHLLEKIAEQDMQLLDEIEEERDQIARKKEKLEAKRQELAQLERATRLRHDELAQQKNEKENLLAAIKTEKATIEKALDELEQASNAIAAKIRAIQARQNARPGDSSGSGSKTGGRFGGVLSWPTPGYTTITSDYGSRVHPILGVRKLHTGIDIGAPSGAGVYSAGSGVVIHAGWLGAYGNTVVVDHGGGIATLYGHLSSISVREGQAVGNQDRIGSVGSTGLSTGPHLHFEVRVNGNPVSPWGYLR
ncbi:MAG: peptidoglycan DD-metalloendopeptidase family protein [Clostridia bacterium]|nr:peptidoglycan DD-metalloendopeptidase family protein [Clostridia bacterium]